MANEKQSDKEKNVDLIKTIVRQRLRLAPAFSKEEVRVIEHFLGEDSPTFSTPPEPKEEKEAAHHHEPVAAPPTGSKK